MTIEQLKKWITDTFWNRAEVAGWVERFFFRKAVHRQTSSGATHAGLPIVLDADGLLDSTFYGNPLEVEDASAPGIRLDETTHARNFLIQYVGAVSGADSYFRLRSSDAGSVDAITVNWDTSNVGIGTSTPQVLVHVLSSAVSGADYNAGDPLTIERNGSSNINIITGTANNGGILFSDDTRARGAMFYDHSADALIYWTNGTEKMRVTSAGRLGILNTAPDALLTVGDVGGTEGEIQVQSNGGRIVVLEADDTGNLAHVGTTTNHGFQIITNDTVRITILAAGNVGINNVSPDALLTVGDVGGTDGEIQVQSNGGRIVTLEVDDTGNLAHVGTTTNHGLHIVTNDTPRITVSSSGLTAISTASMAAAAQLDVSQASTTAAIPVLKLEQLDVDQDMMEFATTIGTGNAIEAVGAKTLTTTHFVKVTLPGGLTRYFPVGTIA